jgi:hypothetical protein
VPFQSTVEALEKFAPFTVRVKVEAPLKADWGAREDKTGTGLKAEPVTAVVEVAVLLAAFGSGWSAFAVAAAVKVPIKDG